MTKMDMQTTARILRQQGKSVGAIAQELGVSKSSVSLWVRDIELSEIQ
jgi:predicted transcriptional regulator